MKTDPSKIPPIKVQRGGWRSNGQEGHYTILDGNHRYAAAKKAGLKDIEAEVSESTGHLIRRLAEHKNGCETCGYSGNSVSKPGAYDNWQKPTRAEAHTEYDREMPKQAHLGKLWRDKEHFADDVDKANVETIPHHIHADMDYATHHQSIADIKHLTSTYAHPRDVDSITRGYHEHAAMPTPIVLKHRLDGDDKPRYKVMGGNTRLAVAEVHGVPRKATVIDVTDHLRKTGRHF
jgi:hypothetical protein